MKELKKLSGLKTIKILNVGGNESLDGLGDGIKKEVLILLEDFKFFKINDEEVSSMLVEAIINTWPCNILNRLLKTM